MATYDELYGLSIGGDTANDDMRNKVAVACVIAANNYMVAVSPTAAQLDWAVGCINDPRGEAARVWPLVLAANSGASEAAILAASDAAIQTNVNAVVDNLAAAVGA